MKDDLILLHGFGFDASIWNSFHPHLTDTFNVITLDLLGFGKKIMNHSPITLHNMTTDILQQAPAKAHYLGWSLGGLVAMNIAHSYPERIKHLFCLCSSPKFVALHQWPGMTQHAIDEFQYSIQVNQQKTLQRFINLQFLGCSNAATLRRQMQKIMTSKKFPDKHNGLQDSLKILATTDLRHKLTKITSTQTYIFAENDYLVPKTVVKPLSRLTNYATVEVLANLNHAPFLIAPQLCAEKIKKAYYEHYREKKNSSSI